MWDVLSYKWELWKLQREKEKIRKYYDRQIDKAHKENKSQDDIDMIVSHEIGESDYIEDQIMQMQHNLLVRQAERYLIPIATDISEDGAFEQSRITGRWRLSDRGLLELKQAIRQEEKDRRERWLSWLAALTGLIGVLIGLLSVI